MGTSVQAPDSRNYAQETAQTLKAQIGLAPEKFAAEQKFAPQYQQMQLDMLKSAAPQLMDLFSQISPQLSGIESQDRTLSRTADIADFEKLGPQARAAMAATSPGEAKLVDTMVADAGRGLAAGTSLTPEQSRAAQQQSRSAFAARGLGTTPGGAVDEIVRSQVAGQAAKQQRLGNANNALSMSKSFYGDPFQQTLGRSSQAFGATQGVTGQAGGFNPGQLFNPESQYAGDIYNQSWQGNLAANTASAANKTALIGAGISAAGSAASSL